MQWPLFFFCNSRCEQLLPSSWHSLENITCSRRKTKTLKLMRITLIINSFFSLSLFDCREFWLSGNALCYRSGLSAPSVPCARIWWIKKLKECGWSKWDWSSNFPHKLTCCGRRSMLLCRQQLRGNVQPAAMMIAQHPNHRGSGSKFSKSSFQIIKKTAVTHHAVPSEAGLLLRACHVIGSSQEVQVQVTLTTTGSCRCEPPIIRRLRPSSCLTPF